MTRLERILAALGLLTPVALAQDGTEFVPPATLETIGDLLPEQNNAGAAYLSDLYSPNVVVEEPAEVRVVFLHEGAGYRNSLGYFTYLENPDGSVTIVDRQLLIPDASFGVIGSGDSFALRDAVGAVRVFQPGTRIGFFLVADGWDKASDAIQGWDPTAPPAIPADSPEGNADIGRGCYTSLRKLNPEYGVGAVDEARHLAMLWFPAEPGFMDGEPYLVCGFEDQDRLKNSDDDFNDLVFTVAANPIEAIDSTEAFVYSPGDADGDGVVGELDHYPDDSDRATVERLPSLGEHVVGFEDQYPSIGDADFNDAVVAWHRDAVRAADGRVSDVQLTAHLVARGAGYDHVLGWRFGVPEGATGTVRIERFLSDAEGTREVVEGRIEDLAVEGELLLELFPSTYAALPPVLGATFTNTMFEAIDGPGASARVSLSFDTPQAVAVHGDFGLDPTTGEALTYAYPDLYLGVRRGDEVWDVHLPGYPPLVERPESLPAEELAPEEGEPFQTFYDDAGRPWALLVPFEWRFPLEQVRVWEAYPKFDKWVKQQGYGFADWYEFPSKQPNTLGFELFDYVPTRDWSVGLPKP